MVLAPGSRGITPMGVLPAPGLAAAGDLSPEEGMSRTRQVAMVDL
jgi:hypothetical protein